MNGIILMDSKSPFLFQGLSAQVKTGAMYASNRSETTTPYGGISVRFAKAFNNKVAFKLNFNQLTADDWQSTDTRDQSLLNGTFLGAGSRVTNLAYNGVSVYGDSWCWCIRLLYNHIWNMNKYCSYCIVINCYSWCYSWCCSYTWCVCY